MISPRNLALLSLAILVVLAVAIILAAVIMARAVDHLGTYDDLNIDIEGGKVRAQRFINNGRDQ